MTFHHLRKTRSASGMSFRKSPIVFSVFRKLVINYKKTQIPSRQRNIWMPRGPALKPQNLFVLSVALYYNVLDKSTTKDESPIETLT